MVWWISTTPITGGERKFWFSQDLKSSTLYISHFVPLCEKQAVVIHQLSFRNPVFFINWVKKYMPPTHVLTRANAVSPWCTFGNCPMHWPMVVTWIKMPFCKVRVELTFVQALLYNCEFFWSTVFSILPLEITFIKWVFVLTSAYNWEIFSSRVIFPTCKHQVHQLDFRQSLSTTGKWPDLVCFCLLCQQVRWLKSNSKSSSSTGFFGPIIGVYWEVIKDYNNIWNILNNQFDNYLGVKNVSEEYIDPFFDTLQLHCNKHSPYMNCPMLPAYSNKLTIVFFTPLPYTPIFLIAW